MSDFSRTHWLSNGLTGLTMPGTTTGNPNALSRGGGGGGLLPYIGYLGMCRCEGYGFQAVYSRIAYINQSVWV